MQVGVGLGVAVAVGVGVGEVDGRRQDALLEGQGEGDGLDGAGGADQVADH